MNAQKAEQVYRLLDRIYKLNVKLIFIDKCKDNKHNLYIQAFNDTEKAQIIEIGSKEYSHLNILDYQEEIMTELSKKIFAERESLISQLEKL